MDIIYYLILNQLQVSKHNFIILYHNCYNNDIYDMCNNLI